MDMFVWMLAGGSESGNEEDLNRADKQNGYFERKGTIRQLREPWAFCWQRNATEK